MKIQQVTTVLLILLLAGCTSSSKIFPTGTPTPTRTPTPTPKPEKTTVRLSFSGKVVNPESSEWPNNRLVVLYLRRPVIGEEIGRFVTVMGESKLSGEGKTDGFFKVTVDNIYEIPSNRFEFGNTRKKSQIENEGGVLGIGAKSVLNVWLGELEEGNLYRIPVPSKNLEYAIKIFATDVSYLPHELMTPGSTRITPGNNVVLVQSTNTGQPSDPGQVTIQGIKYTPGQKINEINKITVPINNCGGSTVVSQEYSYQQTFVHKYQRGGSIGTDMSIPMPKGWPEVVIKLQAKYGFEEGQVDSKKVEYRMAAEPGTKVAYVVTWNETWETGVATALVGENAVDIPFEVRTNVTYAIDSQKFDCK